MDDVFVNEHNYVRPDTLSLVSVEALAIVTVILYFLWLALNKRATLENAFFLSLPFTDSIFRPFMVQPSEFIGLLLVVFNLRSLRLTPLLLVAATFLVFSIGGSLSADLPGSYSFLYSCRFLLTAVIFSTLVNRPTTLTADVIRFSVITTFLWTYLQVGLWTAGLPIDGVFFNGFVPRPKGLAHRAGDMCHLDREPVAVHQSLSPGIRFHGHGRGFLVSDVFHIWFCLGGGLFHHPRAACPDFDACAANPRGRRELRGRSLSAGPDLCFCGTSRGSHDRD